MVFSPFPPPPPRAAWPRDRIARAARMFVLTVAALILLPYLLTPLYFVLRPVSTPMLWRYLTFQRVERIYVPLASMSPVLPLTVIAAEDARFCSHMGIDWQGIRDAIEDADDIEDLRGGSTITQQVAKNLFLWQGRSFLRKALEFPLAIWIDLILPKRRIMEIYLNIAEWGPDGEFGAEAGARRAFGRPAANVSAHEASLLSAILPNPIVRNARQPGPSVRRIAGIHARRAASSGPLDDCIRDRRPR
jgi:monofunctional biosynthetic peptidoglycan transglycosylase